MVILTKQPTPSGTSKALLLALTIVALSTAVGLWRWYVSPTRSLKTIQSAIRSHDWRTFVKYVDVDSVSTDLVDASSFDAGGHPREIEKPREQMVTEIRNAIRSGVEEGKLDQGGPLDLDYRAIDSITRDGAVATASLRIDDETLKILMRNKGSYWQVFKIDIDKSQRREEARESASRQASRNAPKQLEINNALRITPLSPPKIELVEARFQITVPVRITNTGSRPIVHFIACMYYKRDDGYIYSGANMTSSERLEPGASRDEVWRVEMGNEPAVDHIAASAVTFEGGAVISVEDPNAQYVISRVRPEELTRSAEP